jgi:putative membrane protein
MSDLVDSIFTRRHCTRLIGAGIFSGAVLSTISGVGAASGQKTKSGSPLADAAEFSGKAAVSDMFEVESGKLAVSKAAAGEVKSFGQMMIDAHTKTSAELQKIAADEGFASSLPKALDSKHAGLLQQLKDLSGAPFDRRYVTMQVDAHKQAAALFDAYAAKGANPALKQFAAKTVVDIKKHLEHAQSLARKLQV